LPFPKDEVAFVVTGTDSGLMAIVVDDSTPLVIGVESSVVSLLFSNPLVFTQDTVEAKRRLAQLANLDETKIAIDQAREIVTHEGDFLEDDILGEELASPVLAFFALPPVEDEVEGQLRALAMGVTLENEAQDDFVDSIEGFNSKSPIDLEVPGFPLNRLATMALPQSLSERGLPVVGVKFDAVRLRELEDLIRDILGASVTIRGNSLEWGARLYELNSEFDLINSRRKAEMLKGDYTTVFPRTQERAIGRVIVGAKPGVGNVDVLGVVKDLLFAKLIPALNPPTKLEVPAQRSGLYMIRSFSGARFTPQNALLDDVPGGGGSVST
jgi:hypothetical protein